MIKIREERYKQKQKQDFLVYLDDDGEKKEIFADIIEFTQAYIKFKSNSGNIVTIPMGRILKVKQKEDSKND